MWRKDNNYINSLTIHKVVIKVYGFKFVLLASLSVENIFIVLFVESLFFFAYNSSNIVFCVLEKSVGMH